MARKKADPGKREAASLRRNQAVALRVGGAQFRDIARTLGVSLSVAHGDVQRGLKEDKALHQGEIEQERAIQERRLEGLWLQAWKRYLQGDFGTWVACLRILERQARLFGLDAPVQTRVAGPDGGPVQVQAQTIVAFDAVTLAEAFQVLVTAGVLSAEKLPEAPV